MNTHIYIQTYFLVTIKTSFHMIIPLTALYIEEFEDTKGAIRICISKKNRQHNGQKKKYKSTKGQTTINKIYTYI